jgi:hypothetical protein
MLIDCDLAAGFKKQAGFQSSEQQIWVLRFAIDMQMRAARRLGISMAFVKNRRELVEIK